MASATALAVTGQAMTPPAGVPNALPPLTQSNFSTAIIGSGQAVTGSIMPTNTGGSVSTYSPPDPNDPNNPANNVAGGIYQPAAGTGNPQGTAPATNSTDWKQYLFAGILGLVAVVLIGGSFIGKSDVINVATKAAAALA